MTIRDRIIQTGNIALAGDSFRFAEPGAWIRAPTSTLPSRIPQGRTAPCGRLFARDSEKNPCYFCRAGI